MASEEEGKKLSVVMSMWGRARAGRRRSLSDGDKEQLPKLDEHSLETSARSSTRLKKGLGGKRCVESLMDLVHHFESPGSSGRIPSRRRGCEEKEGAGADPEHASLGAGSGSPQKVSKKSSKIILPLLAAISQENRSLKMDERSDRGGVDDDDDEDVSFEVVEAAVRELQSQLSVTCTEKGKDEGTSSVTTLKPTSSSGGPKESQGRGTRNAPSPSPSGSSSSPRHIKAHVSATGPRRIMTLAGKGDWGAVDLALKGLEKAAQSPIGSLKSSKSDASLLPLAGICDENTGQTPLMCAAGDNKLALMERMVDLGADVNAVNKDGFSVLHIAAAHSKEEIIKFLLSKKADPMLKGGPRDFTPLHVASGRSQGATVGVVKVLLNACPKDARLTKDKFGDIPLFIALEAGNLVIAKELLSHLTEAQLAQRRQHNEDSPLHVAVRRREVDLVRALVEHRVKIDSQNAEGQTPLHVAAALGDEAIVKYFYTLHANANLLDHEDRTPLHLAAENGNTHIVEMLSEKFRASVFDRTKDGSTLIHVASKHGHQDTAMAFLRKGVHLRMPNKAGWRSLHVAAERGHVNVVNALLNKGEVVDAVTNDRMTPLHISVLAGKPDVVETLLGHGAAVEMRGGQYLETPLHLAARSEDGEKCAEMLVKCGATIEAKTEDGRTPLHIAAKLGHIRVVDILLREDADCAEKSVCGDTPLHLACEFSHSAVVRRFLEYVRLRHADQAAHALALLVNVENAIGETALHRIAKATPQQEHHTGENKEICEMLIEAGAKVDVITKTSRETPVHYASRAGNRPVLEILLNALHGNNRQRVVNQQSSNGWSALLSAACEGHKEVAELLLQHHARVDVFDTEGKAALHLAAEIGSRELCDLLLTHRAFVNSKSMSGMSAVHIAAEKGFNDLIKVLVVKHGGQPEGLTLVKRTPLHLAAAAGRLAVCRTLVEMGVNINAADAERQIPMHLAAENNHSDVVKFFLNVQPEGVSIANRNGNTCAHIAAEKGSIEVVRELLKFNKNVVASARNKTSDSTPLHLAAKGGHAELVQVLVQEGASPTDENRWGETAFHLAARFGYMSVFEVLRDVASPRTVSRKTGLTPLHVAAFYGQPEMVQSILPTVPATTPSAPPANISVSVLKELGSESGLTPLHLAAYAGNETVVRLLLNSPGVNPEATTNLHGYTPLHLSCQGGHLAVAGLLISRNTEQLDVADKRGRTGLHLAASAGHSDMVALLLGQGAYIHSTDRNGWTALHYAAKAGHLESVRLLVESGASTKEETKEGKIPLSYAASSEHQDVISYLLQKEHNTYSLLEDKKFVLDLMWTSRKDRLSQLAEFVLVSAAPVDTAAKLSHMLRQLSLREKDRSKDLEEAAVFTEEMAKELVSLAAGSSSAGLLLRSLDHRNFPLLDVLIEHEQKEVIAHSSVQKYLGEVWKGSLTWSQWQIVILFLLFLFCPPVWVAFSLPLHKYSRIPLIKFMSYLASHIFFIVLLILTIVTPLRPIWLSTNLIPTWYEWLLLAWISGNLVAELTNPGDRAGLGWLRVMILIVCGIAIGIHLIAFSMEREQRMIALYGRNQFLALALLLCCVQLLDFLTFHHLFGPWAIIISNLMVDLGRFLIIMAIFIFGFSMNLAAVYQPVFPIYAAPNATLGDGYPPQDAPVQTPLDCFELLFYALFGLVEPDYLPPMHAHPYWAPQVTKVVLGVYLMVTVVVLINLLIAMMSDTYQRIQSKSDTEWKFGLAKLIRNMNRTSGTPSPLNLMTKFLVYMHACVKYKGNLCRTDAQEYLRSDHIPDDPHRLDVAQLGTKGWVNSIKKHRNGGRVGPKETTPLGRVMSAGGTSISQQDTYSSRRIEHVIDWNRVTQKYLTLVGQQNKLSSEEENLQSGTAGTGGNGELMGSVQSVPNLSSRDAPNSGAALVPSGGPSSLPHTTSAPVLQQPNTISGIPNWSM